MKFLFYGILGIFVQQTFLSVVAPILIEERENILNMKFRSKEGIKRLIFLVLRLLSIILLSAFQATMCLYFAHKYFHLPLRGSIGYSYLLLFLFLINLTAICFFLASAFENVVHCAQLCMFLSVPTLLTAGYIWPEFMMPNGFESVLRNVWPLLFFITPLRDLHLKGVSLSVISPYIQGALHFMILWLPISFGLYLLRIYVTKRIRRKINAALIEDENVEISTEATPSEVTEQPSVT